MTLTIISGAAPGAEQGAIEAAVNLAIRWHGWASQQHLAALALSPIYRTGLRATSATDPGMVRRLNCQDADGALVFSTSMVLTGVAAFVDRVTEQMGRAFLHVTMNPDALAAPLPVEVRAHVQDWIRKNELARVYVTGPSSDDVPGIQGAVRDALVAILEPFAVDEVRETTRVLGLIERAAMSPPTDPRYSRQYSDAEALAFDEPTDCRGEPLDIAAPLHVHQTPPGPPEGLDELQRAQLDASIREAERDIRADQPPAPGDQTV